jgi:hypothetical protein
VNEDGDGDDQSLDDVRSDQLILYTPESAMPAAGPVEDYAGQPFEKADRRLGR